MRKRTVKTVICPFCISAEYYGSAKGLWIVRRRKVAGAWMTLSGHFALNSVLRRYVWSSEAWLSKLGYSWTCSECCRRTLNRKEQLRHRAVSNGGIRTLVLSHLSQAFTVRSLRPLQPDDACVYLYPLCRCSHMSGYKLCLDRSRRRPYVYTCRWLSLAPSRSNCETSNCCRPASSSCPSLPVPTCKVLSRNRCRPKSCYMCKSSNTAHIRVPCVVPTKM